MSARTHNFRIGLFVLTGFALLAGGLLAMGVRGYFGARNEFETYVPGGVDNLSVGALVKLRGVTIGKVTGIDFAGKEQPGLKNQAVMICFEVPKSFDWGAEGSDLQKALDKEAARGLRARVQGQGFLGASIVSLEYVDPGLYPLEPLPWTPKHYYIPSAPSQLNRVLVSLEKSLRHVENVDVGPLLARVQDLMDAANRLAANINRVDFNQLGTNATALAAEFRQTNRKLQGTLAEAQSALTDAHSALNGMDLPAVSRQAAALEAKLSGDAMELRRLLSGVDTGELNASLANVRAATDELVDLLNTLQERPSAVVFSKAPGPAKEMEAPPAK